MISTEQGGRQGGSLSADLYKVYVNPLLDTLRNSGLGGKIGNINCCAPTCADDVALIANNPFDIQACTTTSKADLPSNSVCGRVQIFIFSLILLYE
jgi:hypothetical protein